MFAFKQINLTAFSARCRCYPFLFDRSTFVCANSMSYNHHRGFHYEHSSSSPIQPSTTRYPPWERSSFGEFMIMIFENSY